MAIATLRDKKTLFRQFGFRSEKEFIADAVEEKIARLKAMLFSRTAEKVRRGIERVGSDEESILVDFERFRRS